MTSCTAKKQNERVHHGENEVFNEIRPPTPEPARHEKQTPPMTANQDTTVDDYLPQEDELGLTINKDADVQNTPCFLPQTGDDIPAKEQPMGEIGPWATGKVDWSPMSGLTGIRPIVDRYSITRFSPNEWRAKNFETIKKTNDIFDKSRKNEHQTRTQLVRVNALIERTQAESTAELQRRTQLVGKWKKIMEEAIAAMQEEITTMEEERIRLKKSLVILGVPESIAKECIEKRATRPETELVRDTAEEELINEVALIGEIGRLLNKTLEDFNGQQIENRNARERLEMDWSDKKESYELDSASLHLHNNSPTIMFHPGAVRLPPDQASQHYWEHFSRETLEECEKTRKKSLTLRQTLNSILLGAARDIRAQADLVEKALFTRINCTQENLTRFENDLKDILDRLADTEHRIEYLHGIITRYDGFMKVVQTRLFNRSYRPNVENCRDNAQQDLMNEVKTVQSGTSNIISELQEAEAVKKDLTQQRNYLEREIMLKRRTLLIDRDRCMTLRSHYPSAQTLSGGSGM